MSKLDAWFKGGNLTVGQAATHLGIGRGSLYRFIRAEQMPRPDTALALEALTGVTVSDMARDYVTARALS